MQRQVDMFITMHTRHPVRTRVMVRILINAGDPPLLSGILSRLSKVLGLQLIS